MKTAKKVFTIGVSILLWAIILLAALFAFTTLATQDSTKVASLAGYTPMTVKTDSMLPTFATGDLIFIKKTDTAKLAVGDVVCFHTIIENQYALNTHRISDITEENGVRSYTTKGDNNEISDQHIIADGDIVGKYVGKVSGLGRVMDFLSSSMGFLVVIVLPMLLFFIYQLYHLIMVVVEMKKATAAEAAVAAAQAAAAVTAGGNAEAATANAKAAQAQAEAEAALAEAQRLKAEAEATLAAAKATAHKGE
ncbi:MAG: signal peptidase I [Gemmiger sp.]|nr:signal peptidase I [Gemmiger sp.]